MPEGRQCKCGSPDLVQHRVDRGWYICRKCYSLHKSETNRWTRYRLDKATYDTLVALAEGCCQICGTKGELVVDHNHTTRVIRGLLCHPCNKGLGKFRDDPRLLIRAADYVRFVQTPHKVPR